MSTIDQRVVQMQFDNKQFEKGISTSTNSLASFEKSLNSLKGGDKTIDNIGKAANNLKLDGIAESVSTISSRFTTMGIVATTALANIANSAVNAGKVLVSALTVDSIIDGFREYELQIGSVQTILSNTRTKGTTIDQVNSALDELNHYADQTIYNFGEMTRNIGTFTAAGVDLDMAVSSIKGIANLAAVSGSSSMQASVAMYQLSQAIAAGRVSLMDWNSVVNAGMGGELFQNALKRTAEHFGTDVDAMIEKYGSFRESLTQGGWMTADVLTETLKQISGAYTETDLIAQGYTEEQAAEIVALAQDATDAATKVKTFTQLIDTLKEALGSGWAQSWEIIIGDFEEAKELWTDVSEVLGELINSWSEARNAMLQGWSDLGGRTVLIEALGTAFTNLGTILGTIGEAFQEVFPPTTSEQLFDLTQRFKELVESLKPSDEILDKISRTAKGLFSIIDLLGKAFTTIAGPVAAVVGAFGNILLSVAAVVGDFFTALNEGVESGDVFGKLGDALSSVTGLFTEFSDVVSGGIDGLKGFISDFASGAAERFEWLQSKIQPIFDWIKENIGAGDIFAGLAGGGLFVALKNLGGLFDNLSGILENIPFIGTGGDDQDTTKFSDILDSARESIDSFTTGIQAGTLLEVAIAIGILSVSLGSLAQLDPGNIVKGLGGIGGMLTVLSVGLFAITKILNGFSGVGLLKSGATMILMAEAINILSDALEQIGKLDLGQIGRGLAGVTGALAALSGAMILISKFGNKGKGMIKGSIGMLLAAKAIKEIAEPLKEIGSMDWESIGKGLTGMGAALAGFTASLAVLSKVGGFGALLGGGALLIAVQSLEPITKSLRRIGGMSWEEIAKGLTGMGGALAELATATGVLGKLTGFSGILGAGSILIAVQALEPISDSLREIGSLSWEEIAKGLSGMGGALAELAITSGVLGKLTGFSGVLGAGSILIAVQALEPISEALKNIGSLSWEEIGKGLVGMGAALAELALITGVLGTVAPLGGILGGAGILIGVQSLGDLADALSKFGDMSWEEIGRGLVAMGGALAELALVTGVLGTVAPLGSIIGSGSLLIAVQGLGDLADAFKKFGDMDWDQIAKGFVGMIAALGATGLGGVLNTFSGFGAEAVSTMSQSLGELASVLKKFANMSWEDVVKGATSMVTALGATGIGGLFNTFSGFGAESISTMAKPLGDLATSVMKWKNVTVPEDLSYNLYNLAQGVEAFTFAGLGGDAISKAATGLGPLADGVRNWQNVTVPSTIKDDLTNLADGVGAFTFSFAGGWSINEIKGPLGDLADTVSKWKGVTVPATIKDDLINLADGVGAFTFAFAAGWSIDAIKTPLSDLADVVTKWNGVSVPQGINEQLTNLSNAILGFSQTMSSAGDLGLATVAQNISDAGTQIQTSLSQLATSLMGDTAPIVVAFGSLKATFESQSSGYSTVGDDIVNALIQGATAAFAVGEQQFALHGRNMMDKVREGMKSRESSILNICRSISSAAANAMSNYNSFYNAGLQSANGFSDGFSRGASRVINEAASVAAKALQAAKNELDQHSPSREFMKVGMYSDEGFAIGFDKYSGQVENSARNVASRALTAVQGAMSDISDIVNNGGMFDMSPRITPVIDMSAVSYGSKKLNGMSTSLNLARNVSSTANANRQNALAANNPETNSSTQPSISFTQNNYSPKALSRIDIYRDTKNQLSRMKGALS